MSIIVSAECFGKDSLVGPEVCDGEWSGLTNEFCEKRQDNRQKVPKSWLHEFCLPLTKPDGSIGEGSEDELQLLKMVGDGEELRFSIRSNSKK